MAPLDVVSAQSEVASREEGVIVAENQLFESEDALKQVLFARNPDTWATRIVPDGPPHRRARSRGHRGRGAQRLREAHRHRGRAQGARARRNTTSSSRRTRRLPQVDLVASYGGSGVGGTAILRDPPGSDNIVETIPGGYGDAVSEAFGFDFPTWRVGVNFSYAIPNRSAKAASATGPARPRAGQGRLRAASLLNAAVEVRIAGRAVETNIKRVASTRAARTLAAQRLDAEEKKFAAGMSTNFLVTQAQRDLALAEVNELRRGGRLPQERDHVRARAGGGPRLRRGGAERGRRHPLHASPAAT